MEDLERALSGEKILRGADLRGANLCGADLRGANLEFASITLACMTFEDVRVSQAQFKRLNEELLAKLIVED